MWQRQVLENDGRAYYRSTRPWVIGSFEEENLSKRTQVRIPMKLLGQMLP
jgi:hypothetical protein